MFSIFVLLESPLVQCTHSGHSILLHKSLVCKRVNNAGHQSRQLHPTAVKNPLEKSAGHVYVYGNILSWHTEKQIYQLIYYFALFYTTWKGFWLENLLQKVISVVLVVNS